MARYPAEMQKALESLTRLPGIGPRSAQRIIFHLLRKPLPETESLSRSLVDLKSKIKFCSICGNLTTASPCPICRDERRDHRLICVVEDPKDVIALEEPGKFRGVYHVLMGKIVPLDGFGPEDIRIKELIGRVKKTHPREIIIATSSDVDGETTALYLHRALKSTGLTMKISRIAAGIPVGSALDFIDPTTLMKALEGRRPF